MVPKMATKFVPNSSLVSLLVWIITATLMSTVETQSISSYSAVKGKKAHKESVTLFVRTFSMHMFVGQLVQTFNAINEVGEI